MVIYTGNTTFARLTYHCPHSIPGLLYQPPATFNVNNKRMKAIFNLFDFRQKVNYKNEVLSGLTVALALIPEAIAFAFIAGLSPLIGLYAAFVMGFVTSILGGRPGMISGATGAVAVVIVALVHSHGRSTFSPL